MKRKVGALILIIILIISGILLLNQSKQPDTKEEALKQAREFVCDKTAATVITPAVHTETGAEYDFGSSCLPKGWEAKIPESCAETYPNGECMPPGKCMTGTDGVANCKSLYPNYPDKN